MQLHRLFWVPQGMAATEGVYVTYPAEEHYAVLSLESHRHQAMIVGENLGTVPPEVYESLDRHEILGMYVVQYELHPESAGLREPPAGSVASLNTHDMPTFRAYWEGRDVAIMEELGFFNPEQARQARDSREALRRMVAAGLPWDPARSAEAAYDAVLRRCLEFLAASPARIVLVNLEDLWREAEPQNVPGTHTERPNWRRKARLSFEGFSARPEVVELLRRVDELRRGRQT
jgi:4-alpha-glucanotransferase